MDDRIAATNTLNSAIDALDRIHLGGNYYVMAEVIIALYDALTATPEPEPVRVPAEVVERICDAYEAWFGASPAGMAMEDETWFVYEKKPEPVLVGWEPTSRFARIPRPERFNLPTPAEIDWRESWHPRPGPPAEPRRDYVTTAIEA